MLRDMMLLPRVPFGSLAFDGVEGVNGCVTVANDDLPPVTVATSSAKADHRDKSTSAPEGVARAQSARHDDVSSSA